MPRRCREPRVARVGAQLPEKITLILADTARAWAACIKLRHEAVRAKAIVGEVGCVGVVGKRQSNEIGRDQKSREERQEWKGRIDRDWTISRDIALGAAQGSLFVQAIEPIHQAVVPSRNMPR